MKTPLQAACAGTSRDRRNQFRMAWWVLAWSAGWVGATYGIRNDWFTQDYLVWIVVAIIGCLGLAMLQAYRRYLREADEMLRKIEVDALAVALGVGMVGGVAYWLLQVAELVTYKDAFIVTILLVCISYSLTVIISHRRYA